MRMKDVPSVAFLIPKKSTSDTQLARFHISLPMGYIDSAPYFCMATDRFTDLANETISLRDQTDKHPLDLATEARAADDSSALTDKAEASWAILPAE